ncbi:MAG: iron-containing alcohol dehydrogenase [Pseudomonadota bacterium]
MTAHDIRFGRGAVMAAVDEIAALGDRLALVHGRNAERAAPLSAALAAQGVALTPIACEREPDLPMLDAALAAASEGGAQAVVALGGGSAIDLGKAVAALVPAPGSPLDHLEVVGRGLPLTARPLPFVAIPTTAGTGAEVTRNAVIGIPEHRRKVSLRDPRMLPHLAIVDPGLTDCAPRPVTLASGLDAVTQVIEPYLSARANPMTDALCLYAIPRGLAALKSLMTREDAAARDTMAFVSLCGGLALGNAGLGAVHGLAGVIGGVAGASHGAVCGALLPHVLSANRAHVATAGGDISRFNEVEHLINSVLDDGFGGTAVNRLSRWSHANGLPGLSAMGVDAAQHAAIAEAAQASSSMKANPVKLPQSALESILASAA